FVAHAHEHLRGAVAGSETNGSWERPGRAVGIAVAETPAKGIGHFSARIHQINGARDLHTGIEESHRVADRQPLAATDALDVDNNGVDGLDARMFADERFKLAPCLKHEGGRSKTWRARDPIHGVPISLPRRMIGAPAGPNKGTRVKESAQDCAQGW